MKHLFSILLLLSFLGEGRAQQTGHEVFPGYTFRILEGIDCPSDAARMDSLLLLLQDLVLSAHTDPQTKIAKVRIADQRVVYDSIHDFLVRFGYTPSKEYEMEEFH